MARLSFEYCDVRDVAEAHILALEKPEETRGKRYIIVENSYWFQDILEKLKTQYKDSSYSFKTNIIPDWIFSMVSLFDKTASIWKYRTNKRYILDNTRSKVELGL